MASKDMGGGGGYGQGSSGGGGGRIVNRPLTKAETSQNKAAETYKTKSAVDPAKSQSARDRWYEREDNIHAEGYDKGNKAGGAKGAVTGVALGIAINDQINQAVKSARTYLDNHNNHVNKNYGGEGMMGKRNSAKPNNATEKKGK
jgi:hypothetical protein